MNFGSQLSQEIEEDIKAKKEGEGEVLSLYFDEWTSKSELQPESPHTREPSSCKKTRVEP